MSNAQLNSLASQENAAFAECALSAEQTKRFRILTSFLSDEQWWNDLLHSGCCIAGGAAMFVADVAQCIELVGDVDVWVPRSVDVYPFLQRLCAWLESQRIEYRIKVHRHMITVANRVMPVQFICAWNELSIADVLDGFDYDCVQCAVYARKARVLRSGAAVFELQIVTSQRAREAFRTRLIGWMNTRKWVISKLSAQSTEYATKTRAEMRESKLLRKQFYLPGTPEEALQDCARFHACCRTHRNVDRSWWNAPNENATTLQSIAEFDVEKHSIHRKAVKSVVEERRERKEDQGEQKEEQKERKEKLKSANSGEKSMQVDEEIQEYPCDCILKKTDVDEEMRYTLDLLRGHSSSHENSRNVWVRVLSREQRRQLGERRRCGEIAREWERLSLECKTRGDHDQANLFLYGARNLALIERGGVTLSEIRNSILSDALKCGVDSFGLAMDSLFFARDDNGKKEMTIASLYRLIEREFAPSSYRGMLL